MLTQHNKTKRFPMLILECQ